MSRTDFESIYYNFVNRMQFCQQKYKNLLTEYNNRSIAKTELSLSYRNHLNVYKMINSTQFVISVEYLLSDYIGRFCRENTFNADTGDAKSLMISEQICY